MLIRGVSMAGFQTKKIKKGLRKGDVLLVGVTMSNYYCIATGGSCKMQNSINPCEFWNSNKYYKYNKRLCIMFC